MVKLSHNDIHSFVGNVIPIRLLGVMEYGMEDIRWSSDNRCVELATFEKDEYEPFTDGALLTLTASGTANVTATYGGEKYTCRVTAGEIESVPSQKGLSYFIGDFHDHTQSTHNRELFSKREERIPYDVIKQIEDEGILDFCVISDHACLMSGREYFRGFWDAHCLGEEKIIVFPGCEAENSPREEDRYGVVHKVAGEIVTVNASNYVNSPSWEKFYEGYSNSPYAISVLAHPQIIGCSVKGVWNFCLDKNNTPRLMEMLKGVEMGNGTDRSCNHLHEYILSVALDNGFNVSTTCSSDWHGPVWGATVCPGRTVIMAKEKTKEAFYDAMVNRRFYASESGNVKLYYEVNGHPAPAILPENNEYSFHVEIGLFSESLGGMPTRIQVVSDYGKTVWESYNIREIMEFTVKSDTARYFYLRLTDSEGCKTWSVPVRTGRSVDSGIYRPVSPISKEGFTAIDEESGCDASVIINDDPYTSFHSEKPTCSILIDMQEAKTISALGHYPTFMDRKYVKEAIEVQLGYYKEGTVDLIEDKVNEFPVSYEVETGMTKENMSLKAKGTFRVFGSEEFVAMPEHEARYVRLRILSTVGRECGRPKYRDSIVSMAEITLFSK